MLKGIIEADETYVGVKQNRHANKKKESVAAWQRW